MTILVYQKIVDGKSISLPMLREDIERLFPNHAIEFHRILTSEGMLDWKVRFLPARSNYKIGSGTLAKGIKIIAIHLHSKKEMLTTLYHEILHFKRPELTEQEVETLAYKRFRQEGAE